MRVEFSRWVEGDLETIGDFIAEDNPRRALSYIRETATRLNALAANRCSISFAPRSAPMRVSPWWEGMSSCFARSERLCASSASSTVVAICRNSSGIDPLSFRQRERNFADSHPPKCRRMSRAFSAREPGSGATKFVA